MFPQAYISTAQTGQTQSQLPYLTLCLDQVVSLLALGEVSPTAQELRPFPKAGPRKVGGAVRRKRKTVILTDTPVKRDLEEQKAT
ncbi:hypothetical protein AAFF_G00325230 [Aldrovandia affinis]|uniref:Uncharacterized protein n=1 Tax=Aldrovandia affinis TaxID=143900 RepID=A0AAD7T937_9TELE|nr:hypothetical protein AAFF_G00325230 [Aldrovandia affinis]